MNIFKIIRGVGMQDQNPEFLNNKIGLVNLISFFNLLFVAIPFSGIAWYNVKEISFVPIIGIVAIGAVFILNYLRFNLVSRYLGVLSTTVLTVMFSAYLTAPSEKMTASLIVLLLVFCFLPFVVFDIREKFHLTVTAGLNAALFLFRDRLSAVFVKDLDASVFNEGLLYDTTMLLSIFLGYTLFFLLSFLAYRAEIKTQRLIDENKMQNDELKDSEELLKKNLEEVQKSQEEEKNRSWVTEGLGRVNTLIRQNDNHERLAEEVIAEVVKYLGANQGAIYLVEKDDSTKEEYMEIKGAFAFGKKKGLKDKVKPGEGLIGQCYLEKDVIYLTEVPQDFIRIKSGLGDAPPRNIIILPLIANEKMEGIIEVASFAILEEFKVDYLKKLGESLASSFNLSKINSQTKELLELSQQQQEEMRSQAEELQQNMEELQATQEEMERKNRETEEQNQQLLQQEEELKQQMEELSAQSEELEKTLSEMEQLQLNLKARETVLNHSTIMSESDLQGTIIFANNKLSEVSKYSQEEMIGQGHNLFRHPDMPKSLFKLLWDTIKAGKVFRGVVKNKAKDGTVYWVDATIAPVKDEDNQVVKYIGVRYVIEQEALAQKLFDEQMERLGLK